MLDSAIFVFVLKADTILVYYKYDINEHDEIPVTQLDSYLRGGKGVFLLACFWQNEFFVICLSIKICLVLAVIGQFTVAVMAKLSCYLLLVKISFAVIEPLPPCPPFHLTLKASYSCL